MPDYCAKATLQAIIRGKVSSENIIYSNGFKGYDGVVDVGYDKHHRIEHGKDEFATGHNPINDIEGFWGVAKTRLAKFRGIRKNTFYLHLKECEFRYNHRSQNLYLIFLKMIRNRFLFKLCPP
ncbi:IS1595 family transposase [Methylomicrobium sp. RS1]|nr:IS1595 family transposase [Methylomicrobium sp. RS1]